MTLIYASKYDEIVAKLEGMRSTVGASWSTVTTYGTGSKPSAMGAGTKITANQINILIEAFNDFELKWTAGSNCSATTSCSVTLSCTGTGGVNSVTLSCTGTGGTYEVTTSCSGTAGNCTTTGGSFSGVYASQIGNRCALSSGASNDTNRGSVKTGHTL